MKRVFLIVLDSFGVGAMPDASEYHDEGVNTLSSVASSPYFHADNLTKMGLFQMEGINTQNKNQPHIATIARMAEASKGKDTTIGHWEIAGIHTNQPLPTYPNGFPEEVIAQLKKITGRGILCNLPYSGTEVILEYGKEHVDTGDLIVYTSADSVLQIAAHEEVVPLEVLYEYCHKVREYMQGEHGVGRVIARPFVGEEGNYKRTSNRHDYSLEPTGETMLTQLKEAGHQVIGVGKINDIFVGQGITDYTYTTSNEDGIQKTLSYMEQDFNGLCFVNLVDFDMLYGHRNDIDGYAKAIGYFDDQLPKMCQLIREDDLLMITADHGCDPGYVTSTDHSREYVPFLMYGKKNEPRNLGTRTTFADIGATILDYLQVPSHIKGTSMLEK